MATDREIIQRIRERDESAFAALVERYGDAVRLHIARLVRDPGLVEDLRQEVLFRAWTRLDSHRGGSLRAWLLRVATNLSLNAIRSGRRRRMQPLGEGDDGGHGEPPWMIDRSSSPPDRLAEQAEHGERIRRAIDALPEGKRDVLRMVHEEHMELRQVAEELGIPVGTVKSRLHYAARRLAVLVRRLDAPEEMD